MFIAALFTVAQFPWKQPKCPSTDEWIKMQSIYTMEYFGAIKKSEILLVVATWIDLEIITQSEVRKRQIPYDITFMWNLKYGTNEQIYKTETHLENRLVELMRDEHDFSPR